MDPEYMTSVFRTSKRGRQIALSNKFKTIWESVEKYAGHGRVGLMNDEQ